MNKFYKTIQSIDHTIEIAKDFYFSKQEEDFPSQYRDSRPRVEVIKKHRQIRNETRVFPGRSFRKSQRLARSSHRKLDQSRSILPGIITGANSQIIGEMLSQSGANKFANENDFRNSNHERPQKEFNALDIEEKEKRYRASNLASKNKRSSRVKSSMKAKHRRRPMTCHPGQSNNKDRAPLKNRRAKAKSNYGKENEPRRVNFQQPQTIHISEIIKEGKRPERDLKTAVTQAVSNQDNLQNSITNQIKTQQNQRCRFLSGKTKPRSSKFLSRKLSSKLGKQKLTRVYSGSHQAWKTNFYSKSKQSSLKIGLERATSALPKLQSDKFTRLLSTKGKSRKSQTGMIAERPIKNRFVNDLLGEFGTVVDGPSSNISNLAENTHSQISEKQRSVQVDFSNWECKSKTNFVKKNILKVRSQSNHYNSTSKQKVCECEEDCSCNLREDLIAQSSLLPKAPSTQPFPAISEASQSDGSVLSSQAEENVKAPQILDNDPWISEKNPVLNDSLSSPSKTAELFYKTEPYERLATPGKMPRTEAQASPSQVNKLNSFEHDSECIKWNICSPVNDQSKELIDFGSNEKFISKIDFLSQECSPMSHSVQSNFFTHNVEHSFTGAGLKTKFGEQGALNNQNGGVAKKRGQEMVIPRRLGNFNDFAMMFN